MPTASYDIGSAATVDPEPTSRKPDNTAFKQQRLPAWQPILSPKSVLPTFFIIAVVFVPIGVVLLVASNGVVEVHKDYTSCYSEHNSSLKCSDLRLNESLMNEPCKCRVNISVATAMTGDIYVYYGLTNFYQNHRRYVKSRDDIQLVGEHVTNNSISQDCKPYRTEIINGIEVPIAPCGAIANSLFNDTFAIYNLSDQPLSVNRTGIAWHTDHTVKFNNPPPANDLKEAFDKYTKPKFWNHSVIQLDPDNNDNNGYKNEAFEVWMRTSAFPTFRKLYGRLNTPLNVGTYSVVVDYNFPVTAFRGTKRIIFSTTSWMGGKNSFLGIAYIVVGAFSFLVGIALSIIHHVTKKNRTE